MKIRLNVSPECQTQLEPMLRAAGFVIDDDAELELTQRDRFAAHICVRNKKGERIRLSAEEIVFIESFGHDVIVHAGDGEQYSASERLYQLAAMLDNTQFLRVSNCAIIARAHVKRIKPSLSMKYILTMSNGALVDVTRSYCSVFREFFHI